MPMSLRPFLVFASSAALILSVAACDQAQRNAEAVADIGPAGWLQQLFDGSDGRDWPAFGRTYGEQHYSPLDQVNTETVDRLGLIWSLDLEPGNPATGPIAVDGIIYFASGYSVAHAVDAATGKLLWKYNPKAPEASGHKLRQGWGSRGIAYWNGKVYIATQDGRLIAIDARTGNPVWSAMTMEKDAQRFISGPPRVFDGMVVIGNGGADEAAIRGYATAYDAETGEQKWRFYTVPGNPADGFEDKAMEMAAKTWSGEYWKHGGGGTVWNAITYDREFDTLYLGTGNGSPWNHKIRSEGKGDNLFLSSIIALDAKTGAYKWHYQTNPGESWDFNAAMDMQLADLVIDGKPRKVLMTAPKNGFFYVLDRTDGKLISAEPFVTTTWAKSIDLKTGRPNEEPNIRYENAPSTIRPTPVGAHSWTPMAFSPKAGLVFIPAIDLEATFDDRGITAENWERTPGMALDYGVRLDVRPPADAKSLSYLIAWDPVTQKAAWRVPTPGHFNGGVMATGGDLVFQGHPDSSFTAYDAKTGRALWNFDAKAPIVAPPITYTVGGRQYVTVIAGMGTSAGLFGPLLEPFGIDYRAQKRRVLTFALDGKATLPPKVPYKAVAVADPDFRPDPVVAKQGEHIFNIRCSVCHGGGAIAGGTAPDLRTSGAILSEDTMTAIIHDGILVPNGMPRFEEMSAEDREAIRQYLRMRAADLREGRR
ncbi:PQQ-dependent dehydrogenase, methanol/ethanol family [Enterovirga sp. GCM10030262]|uniref:PQQ-dependent dehydrogenase, methanol/ethanol family n=1 Tax=Enterovirga sp. GCM10030262 TaxID=3273391 RepID=UPI00362123B7